MPRGDFITRNSFYEALSAGSIPVVMQEDYFRHCAFFQYVNYSSFVTLLPEREFMPNTSRNAVDMVEEMHNDTEAATRIVRLWQARFILHFSHVKLSELCMSEADREDVYMACCSACSENRVLSTLGFSH